MKQVKVENINQHKYLLYTLMPEEALDSVTLGMIENNEVKGLIPTSFFQKDDKQILRYDISGMIVLAEFLKCDPDGIRLVLILKDLSDILLEAKDYMIEESFFLFGMYSVFVGGDGKGRLACLPVENRNGSTFCQFCGKLIQQVYLSGKDTTGVLKQVLEYLENGRFSVREFSAFLSKLELQSAISQSPQQSKANKVVLRKASGPVVLTGKDRISRIMSQSKSIRGYLYRRSSSEKIEVDRQEFRIGKSKKDIDYCIADNPRISRRHAVIRQHGDLFSIEDTNSLNHTYVNQVMLKEGENAPLENGTAIRLADEEFLFLTEKDERNVIWEREKKKKT